MILDVEATPTRISKEAEATVTMIERTPERLSLRRKRLAGDVAYGTGELLGWLVKRGIDPHIPVWDKSKRDDGTLSREEFTYDRAGDAYVCPQGKLLCTTGTVHDGTTVLYRERSSIAIHVRSRRGLVPTRPPARSRTTSMRRPGTTHDHWPRPRLMRSSVAREKRSRCCLAM